MGNRYPGMNLTKFCNVMVSRQGKSCLVSVFDMGEVYGTRRGLDLIGICGKEALVEY